MICVVNVVLFVFVLIIGVIFVVSVVMWVMCFVCDFSLLWNVIFVSGLFMLFRLLWFIVCRLFF